jgi:hypothetical protein
MRSMSFSPYLPPLLPLPLFSPLSLPLSLSTHRVVPNGSDLVLALHEVHELLVLSPSLSPPLLLFLCVCVCVSLCLSLCRLTVSFLTERTLSLPHMRSISFSSAAVRFSLNDTGADSSIGVSSSTARRLAPPSASQ